MPRKKREESPTGYYHWIVRGINKKIIFHSIEDYEQFKLLLLGYKTPYQISIYHYCLMPNHVHLLISAVGLQQLSVFSHYIQRKYAYFYCAKYQWTGSVFRKRFKTFPIDREEYLLECGPYIERNPLKAEIVYQISEYPHSSFRFYTEGIADNLLTPSPVYLNLSMDEQQRRKLYRNHVTNSRITDHLVDERLLGF